jgi:hypothetical protein
MLYNVIHDVELCIESFGRIRIIEFKLNCKFEISKFIGNLSSFDL